MCMGVCAGFLAQKLGTPGAGKEEGRSSKEKGRSKGMGNGQNLNICQHTSYHPQKVHNLFD